MKDNAIIVVGILMALFGAFMIVGNMPVTVEDFEGDLTVDGNLNVTGAGEFGDDVDMNLNYFLNFPMESWLHIDFSAGVTDVHIGSIPSGTHNQDRHYAQLHTSVDIAPGGGKFVNVSLSDGTNALNVSITGAETSDATMITAFDLDVSAETLSLTYSQTAGGASTGGCVMIHWYYKENE